MTRAIRHSPCITRPIFSVFAHTLAHSPEHLQPPRRPITAWPPRLHAALLIATLLGPSAVRADWLIYEDGTRLPGRLVTEESDAWVFESPRFGTLRASRAEARVETETTASPAPVQNNPALSAPAPLVGVVEPLPLPPAAEAKDASPWSGRISLSLESISEATDRSAFFTTVRLDRRTRRDEASFFASYERRTDNDVLTTELIKSDLSYLRYFKGPWYVQYSPKVEYNLGFKTQDVSLPYVFLRQDLSGGLKVLDGRFGTLRLGTGPVRFDFWLTDENLHEYLTGIGQFATGTLNLPLDVTATLSLARLQMPTISFPPATSGRSSSTKSSPRPCRSAFATRCAAMFPE
jgi:hypothetical protein